MSLRSIFKKLVGMSEKVEEKEEYETFEYEDYMLVEGRQSRIDPLVYKPTVVGMRCPHCKTGLDHMEFVLGEECVKKCPLCGLEMERHFDNLICKVFCERHGYPTEKSEKGE